MREFKKKNKYDFWHSPLALGILFCLLALFAYNMVGLVEKAKDSSKKKSLILDQINTLKERQSSLSSDIAKLKTDEGVEETIRDKYQVVKQGEKEVVIVNDDNKTPISSDTTTDHSFWGFIKKMFTWNH
ncbi:MAG TPA: septum formation initiator family protein [Candidatus Paceibacterota bacterium]|nr:septum formation initiator family protein [Candidatus Paceibacterota bacterium]